MWLDQQQIRTAVAGARTVAVLGAHVEPHRPAFYVPDYLHSKGIRIVPVNPALAGKTVFGEPILESLARIGEPVDILVVFRRSEDVPAHVPEIRAMTHAPAVVWLQSGIRAQSALDTLSGAGIGVVQNRCLMVDHQML